MTKVEVDHRIIMGYADNGNEFLTLQGKRIRDTQRMNDQKYIQPTNSVLKNQPVSIAATDTTISGVEQSTFTTTYIFPIIVAIIGAFFCVLFAKIRPKLRVKIVQRLSEKQFAQLSALYLDRVPDYERVPPNHIRAFFQREYSAKSIRDFNRRIRNTNNPVHLLIIARISGQICGFIKAIFIPDIRCLYVAYLVTESGENYKSRTVTQKLISSLFDVCRAPTTIQSLVFEICAENNSKYDAKAKAKLFRDWGKTHNFQIWHINAIYKQPEICSFESGDCRPFDANLYIAYIHNPLLDSRHSISLDEYKKLVVAIYEYVYLTSYAVAEPQFVERYRGFLLQLLESLFANINSQVIDFE